tara:strand:+ start:1575 stop:3122 length:1548 start_codon:yes stop_codon:yes gene_type:complete
MPKYYDVLDSNELVVLHEVSNLLTSSLDLKESINCVFELLHSRLGFMKGILTVVNQTTMLPSIKVSYGINSEEFKSQSFKQWEAITSKVLQSRGPMIIPHLDEAFDISGIKNVESVEDESFICLPLILGEDIFGTLAVDFLFRDDENLQFIIKLLDVVALLIAQELKLKKLLDIEKESLRKENVSLKHELSEKYDIHNMLGKSKVMRDVYQAIKQVSSSNATVLIRGESGTGKELVAHAIHYQSQRAAKPFIRINCAAIPESLIESELFGHQKGAFTDAFETKIGKFEAAHGGTIFLDEVTELSPQMQVKLLRVLQEKEITRVGGLDVISVDVRMIAATNNDLEKAIQLKKVREDFYYRLNVFPILLPPLRDRNMDVLLLAEHFLERYCLDNNKSISRISSAVSDILTYYQWPGNVRELENCIERAVIMCNGDIVLPKHLPPSIKVLEDEEVFSFSGNVSLKDKVSRYEKKIIIDMLDNVNGNISKAAKSLHTTHRILGYRISQLNIDVDKIKAS